MGLDIDDVVALTYESTFDAQQIRYTLHYIVTTAGSSISPELDLQAMADAFATTLNTLTNALQAVHTDTGWNLNQVTAQRVYPARTIRLLAPTSIPGTIPQVPLPSNSAVTITKRTLTAGRAGIGSLHLTAIPAVWVIESELDPGIVTNYNPLLSALISAQTISAVSMVIAPGLFHQGSTLLPFSRLFDAVLQTTARVMRRRTVRVGI